MKSVRRVLDCVMNGKSVGQSLWDEAITEVEAAERALECIAAIESAKKNGTRPWVLVTQDPRLSDKDQSLVLLNSLYLAANGLLLDVQKREESMEIIDGNFLGLLLQIHEHLKDHGCEPVRCTEGDFIAFKPKKKQP